MDKGKQEKYILLPVSLYPFKCFIHIVPSIFSFGSYTFTIIFLSYITHKIPSQIITTVKAPANDAL